MPKITLKRVTDTNGATADLFPTTTVDQIFTVDGSGDPTSTTLDSHLTSTYIPLSQKGANSGVASLDSSGKLNESQLPASVVGGMKFHGTVDLSSGTSSSPVELSSVFGSLLTYSTWSDAQYDEGSYVVVTAGGFVKDSSGTQNSVAYHRFDIGDSSSSAPGNTYGEELDTSSPYEVEKGDWIVFFDRKAPTGGVNYFLYSIINNTYGDASDSVSGIVQLSDATSVSGMSGNDVITEGVLAGLVGTAAGDLAAGNHLHDGRYYTESEIGSFFSGGTSISGYNKTNWDTAYGWGNHASAGYQSATNSQSVTLSGAVTGTGTISNFGDLSITTTATSDPTLTLAGDATGSATFTNLGNATLTVAVANDSHTHDGRYYTETEFNNWLDGDTAIDGHNFTEILYGASPSSTNVGTILIDID